MEEQQSIPLKISYTDEDVARAAKRDKFTEGTYRGVLTDIVRQVSKDNHHLMFKCVYRMLADPNDAGSVVGPAGYHYQCLPFRNPEFEDHVPAKFFARSTTDWLAAHVPDEVPARPRRDGEGKDAPIVFKGESIEKDQQEECEREAYDAAFSKASAMWEDESNAAIDELKGSAVYFDLYYQDGKDFPSFGNFRSELADGETLVPAEEMIDQSGGTVAVVGATSNGNGAKPAQKTAAKPTAKVAAKPAAKKSNKK
jgi:hypothetical protein